MPHFREVLDIGAANLDLVRSIYADWERGDFGSAKWAHPDIEYVVADGPEPGSWSGLAGMAEAWRGLLSAWKDLRVLAEEYRELDDERVLVLDRFSGQGRASGLDVGEIRTEGAQMFQIRGGKVIKNVAYADRDHALADLGLEE
jgi:ketosteroid isomerase-like protein